MIFNTLALDSDKEWLMIDSTIIRADQHSSGALKYRTCYAKEQGLGRSYQGFNSDLNAFSEMY